MSRSEEIRFLVLHTLGNFLVLVALYGVVATFGPALMYEAQFQIIQFRHIQFTIENEKVTQPKKISEVKTSAIKPSVIPPAVHALGFADILAGNKDQILTPIDPLFSILIPKLGIDEQIIPNVDPDTPQTYLTVLQHAIAHAKGSVLPGDPGTVYLFAHSADTWWDIEHYNAIFYTLNNLSVGDEIVVFYENRRYNYFVSQQVISDPEDTTLLTEQHSGPQQLVLQTCWPPGTTWKRLYIIAKPKSV